VLVGIFYDTADEQSTSVPPSETIATVPEETEVYTPTYITNKETGASARAMEADIIYFDTDGDGEEENILLYSCQGCNKPPREMAIIDDGRLVFFYEGGQLRFIPNEPGSFTVDETNIPADGRRIQTEFLFSAEGNDYVLVEDVSTTDVSDAEKKDINIADMPCDNYDEIQDFEEPIPIVWEAKMDGCLVNCQGGSFTKITEDENEKYLYFAGYYPGKNGKYDSSVDNPIPVEYRGDDLTLKITGDWIGIQADHPNTVFGGLCVSMVDIKEIEII